MDNQNKTESDFRKELLKFSKDNGFIVEIGNINKIKNQEKEFFIRNLLRSKKFKNRITGEIVTQVPLMQIKDYEELKE